MSLSAAGIKDVFAESLGYWKKEKAEEAKMQGLYSLRWCVAAQCLEQLTDLQRDLLRAAKENR